MKAERKRDPVSNKPALMSHLASLTGLSALAKELQSLRVLIEKGTTALVCAVYNSSLGNIEKLLLQPIKSVLVDPWHQLVVEMLPKFVEPGASMLILP